MKAARPITNPAVAKAFDAYPPAARKKLLVLRALILDTAARTAGVGELEETLKWGEPAYVTAQSGSGSTVRIGCKKAAPNEVAVYFNCKTGLVDAFRTLFPNEFKYEGQRAIVFSPDDPVPRDALAFCIAAALTYHRKAKAARA